jgi:hypothetical protein
MSYIKKLGFIGILCLGLASCQTQPLVPASAPVSGFEGEWVDQNGIASTFNNCQFQTKTTDGTNTLLAVGSYTQVSPTLAEIELRSLVRRTVSQVNCALATSTRMNCTSSAGSQFTLMRRS